MSKLEHDLHVLRPPRETARASRSLVVLLVFAIVIGAGGVVATIVSAAGINGNTNTASNKTVLDNRALQQQSAKLGAYQRQAEANQTCELLNRIIVAMHLAPSPCLTLPTQVPTPQATP